MRTYPSSLARGSARSRTWTYTCIHVPTGRVFARMQRFDILDAFYAAIVRWNLSNPTTWLYAATGDAD